MNTYNNKVNISLFVFTLTLALALCLFNATTMAANMKVKIEYWGETQDEQVYLYTVSNGMKLKVTNYGGRITTFKVPDRREKLVDVVLGFDSLEDYLNKPSNFGAAIGRYENRIVGDKTYHIAYLMEQIALL